MRRIRVFNLAIARAPLNWHLLHTSQELPDVDAGQSTRLLTAYLSNRRLMKERSDVEDSGIDGRGSCGSDCERGGCSYSASAMQESWRGGCGLQSAVFGR